MNRAAWALSAVLAASLISAFPAVRAQKSQARTLTILYTSSAHGQIRSCNCTKFRYGGYGRELTLLKSIRETCKEVILLEGGDSTGGDGFQAGMKADVTAQALGLLGYSAMVPGEEELGARGTSYIDRFDPKSVPVVSANLMTREGSEPAFSPYVHVQQHNGLKTAVVGAIGPAAAKNLPSDCEWKITDPNEALASCAGEASKASDFVVLLFHGTLPEARKLSCLEKVDLVLCTHRVKQEALFPESGQNEVQAEVLNEDGTVFVESETKSNWSLGRIDIELDENGRVQSANHRLYYLDRRYDEDPAMVKIYEDYNTRVKEAVLARSKQFAQQTEALLEKRGFDVEEMRQRLRRSPIATASKCKSCHEDEYDAWSESAHAKAISSLKKTNSEFDPECVNCHVTGALVRNGFVNVEQTPDLVDVQCEACHGPGLTHTQSRVIGYSTPGEETCRSCHTTERTPEFDYSRAWAQVKH